MTVKSAGRHLTLDGVIKAYSYGNHEHGSNSGETLYFEGDTLYSYGDHFPLLHKTGNYYLFNIDHYSSTTGKHQSYATKYISSWQIVNVSMRALREAGIDYRVVEVADNEMYGDAVLKFQDNYYLTGKIADAKSGRDMFLYRINIDYAKGLLDQTVENTWKLLEPDYVQEAREEGRDVVFKGGFYFCEERVFRIHETDLSTLDDIIKEQKLEVKRDEYIEGSNYFAKEYIDLRTENRGGQLFVRGYVKDKFRYEKMLKLPKWYNVHKINGEVL